MIFRRQVSDHRDQLPIYDPRRHAERPQLHYEEAYRYFRQQELVAQETHVELSKWLFATLVAVNGGAIFALNFLRPVVPASHLEFLVYGAAQNLLGIFLSLLAGLASWCHFQVLENYAESQARFEMVYSEVAIQPPPWTLRWSLVCATVLGIISGLLFATSAVTILYGLFEVINLQLVS